MADGVPYDSDSGRGTAAAITALMTGRAYRRSAEIAAAIGPLRALRREPRAPQPRDADAPRRLPRDRRRRPARTRSCFARARRSWDEAVELGERHGYRNAQATVLAPTGHHLLPDGLRHHRRGARLLAGEVQGARRRRADDDRQPHRPAGAREPRLLRAADRADRGIPGRARHGHGGPRARRGAPRGLRRRRRRAGDLAHGPHQDDGRRPAVHLRGDLEDRQPSRAGERRGHRRSLHRGLEARDQGARDLPRRLEDRPGAAHRRPEGARAADRRRRDRRAGGRQGARRGRAPAQADAPRAPVDHPQVLDRAATRATSPPGCTRTARSGRSS